MSQETLIESIKDLILKWERDLPCCGKDYGHALQDCIDELRGILRHEE